MSGGGCGGGGEEWEGRKTKRWLWGGGRGGGLREGQKEGEMHTSDTRRISLFRMKSRYQSVAGYTSPETEAEGGGAEINRRGKTEEKKIVIITVCFHIPGDKITQIEKQRF